MNTCTHGYADGTDGGCPYCAPRVPLTSNPTGLAACPFCRRAEFLKFWDSREAHEECEGPHTDGSNDVTWAVVCDATNYGCGASAGFKPTKEEAAAAWNARSHHETTADLATQLGRARQLLEDWLAGHDFDVEAWAPRVRDFLENSNPFNLANRCTCEVSSDAKSIRCTVYVDCPVHGGAPTPTATCPNCGTVDEFSVRHCDPDEVGAVYPVIECHACGQKWSDWRGEDARTAAIESAQKSVAEPSGRIEKQEPLT